MDNITEIRKDLSVKYFDAFHKGYLIEVFNYFDDKGTVEYGVEPPIPAATFFPQTKELIQTLEFKTHGIYGSENTDNIIIHFSFHPKSSEDDVTEAIDIITFNSENKITKVKVIPNAKG